MGVGDNGSGVLVFQRRGRGSLKPAHDQRLSFPSCCSPAPSWRTITGTTTSSFPSCCTRWARHCRPGSGRSCRTPGSHGPHRRTECDGRDVPPHAEPDWPAEWGAGPGWPSTHKQYSAVARASQEESPGRCPRASEHPACSRWPLGPPLPPEVHSAHSLSWRGHFLLVEDHRLVGRSPQDSVLWPSLCLPTVLSLHPSLPAPVGRPLSISCHVVSVLPTTRTRVQLGPLANQGEKLDVSLMFQARLFRGISWKPRGSHRRGVRVATLRECWTSTPIAAYTFTSHLPALGIELLVHTVPTRFSRPPSGPWGHCHAIWTQRPSPQPCSLSPPGTWHAWRFLW